MKTIRERRDSNGDKVAARVTIKDAALMTTDGRRRIANWLRREAKFLETHADELAPTYRASWRYDP